MLNQKLNSIQSNCERKNKRRNPKDLLVGVSWSYTNWIQLIQLIPNWFYDVQLYQKKSQTRSTPRDKTEPQKLQSINYCLIYKVGNNQSGHDVVSFCCIFFLKTHRTISKTADLTGRPYRGGLFQTEAELR